MTSMRSHVGSDELAPDPESSYDLIICHDDRIVFHDHYASPALRLRMLAQLLTLSDVVADAVDASRAGDVSRLHESMADQWSTAPDHVANAIAKLCRTWGVNVYVSTTRKRSAAPEAIFSVVTDYGSGQVIAEHFPSSQARRSSLIERADQCFDAPGRIPERVLSDDARLAALLSALLMPASITLTEAVRDDSGDGPLYRPSGTPLSIR